MLTIENAETYGFPAALRGMRNPMNSWGKSDSVEGVLGQFYVGEADRDLAERLTKAGPDHRKFMRMIFATCDITAPLYWWKEFDTYRAGVEKNSCSTMHKLGSRPLTLDDFSTDGMSEHGVEFLEETIYDLNRRVVSYKAHKEYSDWRDLVCLLPLSYNQRRTCMISYEALKNMYHARRNHKLTEWHTFCDWVDTLPEHQLITEED